LSSSVRLEPDEWYRVAPAKGDDLAIDVENLKAERDRLKEGLRELEVEQRKLEAELKGLRQREIQTKRTIEALTTLIDINDVREEKKPAPEAT
jgi:hypothetical protein